MKARRIILCSTVAAVVFASGALASEIYKWTDENGVVYYADRPHGASNEQRLKLTYRRTDAGAVQQRVQARHDAQASRAEAKSMAEAADKEAAENAAAEQQRQQACERARERLESYVQAQHLYRTGANGERIYLDDEQRAEARSDAEEQVAEFCY